MASTYLSRTASTPTNNKIWTWSGWVKKSFNSGGGGLFSGYQDGNNWTDFYFSGGNVLEMTSYIGASVGITVNTNAVFRDVSAWYHIVVAYDSTQTTASDRVKFYINGILQTINTTTYPSLNYETKINASSISQQIGGGAQAKFNGSMSHINFIDGTAYDASAFGQADANGVWTINTSPSVTYGTNGFFILKDGNSVTDQSGQGNNFTVGGGTLTNTEDSPSNVFATWNPLGMNRDVTFSSGNTHATYGTSGTRDIVTGTLGAVSGKYYWEIEIQGSSSANNAVLGVSLSDWNSGYAVAGETNYAWGFRGYDGAVYNNNSSVGGTWSTFTNGDKIGVAVNLDDEQGGLNKLYFSKNGTWLNGADPSNLTSTTGVVGITKPENGVSGFLFPVISDAGSTATPQFITNFGNGYFGTTAVSSAGTNASGIGIFEYDVPTGFTALSTKGLNL